jgi:hypothetical protein
MQKKSDKSLHQKLLTAQGGSATPIGTLDNVREINKRHGYNRVIVSATPIGL